MKKFLLKLVLLAMCVALGFQYWRIHELRRDREALRQTVLLLEQERRDLQAGSVAKPEEPPGTRAAIEAQTAALRGLAFKEPVTYKIIGRDELRKVLEGKLGEIYSPQELLDYGRTLETLGLIPEGTDLREAILGLYDEQVAAFYVPEERALYTFKDATFAGNLDKVTLAHELTHALQDQNFDLTTFPLKVKDNDDLALATSALVEGDATLLMAQFYGEHLDVRNMLSDVMTGMLGQKTSKFQSAPAYFREMLLFPYQQGTEFATAVFVAGGTDALNESFRHPPVSTKEILHPEKYLHDRQSPEVIQLKTRIPAGWRVIGNNVLGEFGVRSLLAQFLSVLEAQHVAAGWSGDRYEVFERGTNGPTALVWTTAWETDEAANQFEQAYRPLMQKRGVVADVAREGKHVRIVQAKDTAVLSEFK